MVWKREAPVDSIASTLVLLISSMLSYKSLATKPIERRAMAIMPAKIPGPNMVTKSNAQIRELMEREEAIISKAIGRTKVVEGVVFRAAKKAIGNAIITPSSVPKVAMFSVSQRAWYNLLMYSQLGGNMRLIKSAAWVGASETKNQMVSSVITTQQYRVSKMVKNQPLQTIQALRLVWLFHTNFCSNSPIFLSIQKGIHRPIQ